MEDPSAGADRSGSVSCAPRFAGPTRIAGFAKTMLPLLLIAGLAGCVSAESGTIIGAPKTAETGTVLIVPAPNGPAVTGLIERRYANAVQQRVFLSTSSGVVGQNMFDVTMYGPMEWSVMGRERLPYKTLHAADLWVETRAAVPGVAMRTSPLFLRNNYGAFGYAFGRTTQGDACLYGWQQIRASKGDSDNFRNAGMIQVRLRLCDRGASEKELLSVMYGYTLTGGFSSEQWNPYGSLEAEKIAAGANGAPIYPRDSELSAAVKVEQPRVIVRRRVVPARDEAERERAAAARQAQEDEINARRVVDVPSPSGAEETPVIRDNANGARVVVPGPACDADNANCN